MAATRKRISLTTLILGVPMFMQIGIAAYAEDSQMAVLCKRGLKVGVAVQGAEIVATETNLPSKQPEAGYPPYLIPISRNGMDIEAQGLDISIIRLITRKINCPKSSQGVQIYYSDFDSLYDRLRDQQFDFIVAALSLDIPLKKRRGLSFSMPYNDSSGIALAAHPKLAANLNKKFKDEKNLADRLKLLRFKNIYTIKDSFKDGEKLHAITGIKVEGLVESPRDTIKEVLHDAIARNEKTTPPTTMASVVMLDYQALNYLIRSSTTFPSIYDWQLLEINPDADGDDKYLLLKTGDVIAVRSKDLELLTFINRTINEARLEKTLKNIQDEWLRPGSRTSSSELEQFVKPRTLHDAGKAPGPKKWKLGLGGSGGFQLTRKADKDIGVNLNASVEVPRYRQSDWSCKNLKRLLINPFCVRLFDQVGINMEVKASGTSTPDTEIKLTQDISPGIFWRANWPGLQDDQMKPWFELDANMTWMKSTKANKTEAEFQSSNEYAAIFVPKFGLAIPLNTPTVKLQLSAGLDRALMSSGHPTPTLKTEFAIEIALD